MGDGRLVGIVDTASRICCGPACHCARLCSLCVCLALLLLLPLRLARLLQLLHLQQPQGWAVCG